MRVGHWKVSCSRSLGQHSLKLFADLPKTGENNASIQVCSQRLRDVRHNHRNHRSRPLEASAQTAPQQK